VDGCDVLTIEGVARSDDALDRVQQSFHESGVPQCGFCTPGMVLLTKALLQHNSDPDPEQIDRWLSANICRCSGYQVFRRALGSDRAESEAS
jgi:carbon-monoxide dehydrogenase small subunit